MSTEGRTIRLYDRLEAAYESPRTRRRMGTLFVLAFLLTAMLVELGRGGLLPSVVAGLLPASHFYAVHVAFTLLLAVEVVALVFCLGRSVADSVGKQFEVFSLILLRQTFEAFTAFSEPVTWPQARGALLAMVTQTAGALLVFMTLGLYYRMQRHHPITGSGEDQHAFVAAKKRLALVLLLALGAIALDDGFRLASGRTTYPFFEAFYTLLIFSDVLVVLISSRTSFTYPVIFRNSGFAAATVLMRLALTAPAPVNAALGLAATVFAVGLTVAYNRFAPSPLRSLAAA